MYSPDRSSQQTILFTQLISRDARPVESHVVLTLFECAYCLLRLGIRVGLSVATFFSIPGKTAGLTRNSGSVLLFTGQPPPIQPAQDPPMPPSRAYLSLVLAAAAVPAQSQIGLKTIDPPGGGHVVYGAVSGATSLPMAMGSVLRYVHTQAGERPRIGKFFQAKDSDSVATFFTVSSRGKTYAGIAIVTPNGGQPLGAILYDETARFPSTESTMMQALNKAWAATSASGPSPTSAAPPAAPAAVHSGGSARRPQRQHRPPIRLAHQRRRARRAYRRRPQRRNRPYVRALREHLRPSRPAQPESAQQPRIRARYACHLPLWRRCIPVLRFGHQPTAPAQQPAARRLQARSV
jgi:hypothetical protein